MLYAMCGFANFGSLGIMIAGLSTMCPEKRDEVVSLGLEVDRVGDADDVLAGGDRGDADAVARMSGAKSGDVLIPDIATLNPGYEGSCAGAVPSAFHSANQRVKRSPPSSPCPGRHIA